MNLDEVLESPDYDFLKTNPHLGDNLILVAVGGSIAYGTNTDESDIDIRGIAVNRTEDLLGLSRFENFLHEKTDTTIYSLNKIFSLLLNCNPNTIEILGLKPEHYLYVSTLGKTLLDNKSLFLSKRAINSFGGYANQQLMRLKNNIARFTVTQSEKEEHILNSIRNAMYKFNHKYRIFPEGAIKLYRDSATQSDMESEIFMDIHLRHYPLRDYKSMWSEMNNIVKDYAKVGKRNKKKDSKHMAKHMMHLIRLYMMCCDILEKQEVITFREEEHCLLMDIRQGKYMNEDLIRDEFWELLNVYEKRFVYAKNNTNLPDKPDLKKVEELLISMNEQAIGKRNI